MIKETSVLNSPKRIVENFKWAIKTRYPSKYSENLAVKRFLDNRLLAAQEEEVLDELLPFMETVSLSGGDYIYQPDDPVEFLYFPETAVISEFQILEDGRTIEFAM